MFDFLKRTRQNVVDIKTIILETKQVQQSVREAKLSEAMSILRSIKAQEKDLYDQNKHYKNFLKAILDNEIRIIITIIDQLLRELEKGNLWRQKYNLVIAALDYLLAREIEEDKIIEHRLALRRTDEAKALLVKPILEKYIRSGMKVCELFHGEHSDILRMLSILVEKEGKVYGVDEFNPQLPMHENMADIISLRNVELIKAHFPPLPTPKLNAIIVREFHYIFGSGAKEVCYAELDKKIKKKGFLILILNEQEYSSEVVGGKESYSSAVNQFPSKYKKVEFNKRELVFQKQ